MLRASILLLVLATLASCQQRHVALSWADQHVDEGQANVHSFNVFSGANSLSVQVSAHHMSHLAGLQVLLRHGAIPTATEHKVRTTLHGGMKGKSVGLHIENPLQGKWFLVVSAPVSATGQDDSGSIVENNLHKFVPYPGDAVYSVEMRSGGCVRGRFGWPECGQDWMRLSWGRKAEFHGMLTVGRDQWACSMYEVAPYTSTLSFTIQAKHESVSPTKAPQIYARFHAYPTVSEYDTTTAVGGSVWQPSTEVDLPKSGTWYVCVHAPEIMLQETLVSVQVAAQVLPHTECVERNLVAKDGSRVIHETQCENEVQKLEMKYDTALSTDGTVCNSRIPLPTFALANRPKDGFIRIKGDQVRYFSFTLDESIAGFTLRLSMTASTAFGSALVCLRQAALPKTHVYDLRRQMEHGILDWHVRFPLAGEWYMGVFSDVDMKVLLSVMVEACPADCSGNGRCELSNQGGGVVMGVCRCKWGYDGSECQRQAPHLSFVGYYGRLLVAVASTLVALPPALYALYKDWYTEAFVFAAASATGLARELGDLLMLGSKNTGSGVGFDGADAALTEAVVAVSLISAASFPQRIGSALMLIATMVSLLFFASFPTLPITPAVSLAPALASLPILTARRVQHALARAEDGRDRGAAVAVLLKGLRLQWLLAGICLSIMAMLCVVDIRNENYVILHACWRALMYLCATCFLLSARRAGDGMDSEGKQREKDKTVRDETRPLVPTYL